MARVALRDCVAMGLFVVLAGPLRAQEPAPADGFATWDPAELAAFKEASVQASLQASLQASVQASLQASIDEGRRRAELPDRDLATPDSLSCATPCVAGVQQALHPFYDVFLDCANGAFTARTGASHSRAPDPCVINPATSGPRSGAAGRRQDRPMPPR